MSLPNAPPSTPTASYQQLVTVANQVASAFAAAAIEKARDSIEDDRQSSEATLSTSERHDIPHRETDAIESEPCKPSQSNSKMAHQAENHEHPVSTPLDVPHPVSEASGTKTDRSQLERTPLRTPDTHDLSYLETPVTSLPATAPPLMSGVTEGGREPNPSRTKVHSFQRYFVANRCRDIYRITRIHVPELGNIYRDSPVEQQQESFLSQCSTAFLVDKDFEEPVAYTLQVGEGLPLLKIEVTNIADVWQVYNGTLFADIETGIAIGRVHTFKSVVGNVMFAFVPNSRVLMGVPSMQMEPVSVEGLHGGADGLGEYKFTIAQVEKPVGSVTVRRHFFDVELRHCTKEEAVLWMSLLVAAELETKTELVRFVPSL